MPSDDAQRRFDRLLSVGDDVGLPAKGYDPGCQRDLRNVAHPLSRIPLIDAAFESMHVPGPAEQRARSETAKSEAASTQ